MVADGGGWRRWWLWRWRWRLSTMVPMAAMVEGHHPADGGESLAEPFGRLTTATPFGVVPLLGGVHTPFLSLPYSPGENLASVPNEQWRRTTSHPPWGHRFGETSSCKDIVIDLCIGFELQS
uniref:Secreted protein n=1 Tax=Oryza glumipatula TaxID=40148 RepID=A0A0E0BS24_9ORYZ